MFKVQCTFTILIQKIMTTVSSNPKCLTDLKHQDNVIHLSRHKSPQTAANRWFHELFDNYNYVHVRHLFVEEYQDVYECYQDAGSVDYLYIVH